MLPTVHIYVMYKILDALKSWLSSNGTGISCSVCVWCTICPLIYLAGKGQKRTCIFHSSAFWEIAPSTHPADKLQINYNIYSKLQHLQLVQTTLFCFTYFAKVP